ncbi:phosphoribosylaminoimidazolesuccinocarboxamide synthase [Peptacetobacter hiranonis]|uniref:Phosphoribosylaminoimidazole-succinocarboxamide synthase n=1 Tax=Peptacetobacter hiranonis (strain DSM 13275 / JCM 10541 / KCTC 15199 / TO-931) TaxID=500633 RepID=B6G0R3_PEPHT|nr:phosphoribosylaminoimidazolesuccinocarboxamide synthase [Peptacetobacter hiranonis]EEA84639.1 phosphoribosylaminoimidazolesuccinocarboxamide synthase [Peptacetobacter hiranonis DSM 13275]QEK21690.1 Phosphoribosylaminoimidazole-succinocarboxamide synthase [Peptacetobacter hiranonis]
MNKGKMLYEGKAKRVYEIEGNDDCLLISYKDDATAFNGLKKGQIDGKGVINNRMANFIFKKLEEEKGVETHLVEEISDRETIVKKVEIVPLEIIVRNIAAGSFSKRFGVEEGTVLKNPTLEFCLKDDALGDPMINDSQIMAIGAATKEELYAIKDMTMKINDFLIEYFKQADIELVDFKIEMGRYHGRIILADEISPDTCRLWDINTHEKLDKDRFRRDMGGVKEAYDEVMSRLGI